jgi:hypothetical protein
LAFCRRRRLLHDFRFVGGQPFLHAGLVAERPFVLGFLGLGDDDGPQLPLRDPGLEGLG